MGFETAAAAARVVGGGGVGGLDRGGEGGSEGNSGGLTTKSVERWKAEMPTEAQMLPRDKYSMFDRKEKGYRKGVHSESPFIYFRHSFSGPVSLVTWYHLAWASLSSETGGDSPE